MKQLSFIFLSAVLLCFSCGKDSPGTTNIAPTNLTVNAVVSTDNSGNVAFTASATNAVTYDYDYGNGIFQTVVSGVVTYRYPASGVYTVNVIAKSSSGQTISKSIQVTVTVAQSLIWSEEFDTPGAPNPAKWGYDLGAGGWGNNELQYYTNRPDNAVVSGGTLKIIAKAENFSGSPYTSARLLSKDKFSFKYGKLEARAKLPFGAGTWAAIWMLGSNINTVPWPGCGEIDIMEHVGNQQNKIFGTLHHPGHSGGNGDGSSVVIANASTEFHRYGLEWTASTIKISVDDFTFFTFPNSAGLPFNQNFFIILNIAMGGNFGGAVDPAFVSSTMEIDYIRVYQ
ncbi:MAG: family 16 glycosylhydrolase [Chitinophagaceae bacterium]|jgi:beta-glucanase (GH16 family)|nr:family 16 glycosylhydrolase [Chitinophagaceae bacterium]